MDKSGQGCDQGTRVVDRSGCRHRDQEDKPRRQDFCQWSGQRAKGHP